MFFSSFLCSCSSSLLFFLFFLHFFFALLFFNLFLFSLLFFSFFPFSYSIIFLLFFFLEHFYWGASFYFSPYFLHNMKWWCSISIHKSIWLLLFSKISFAIDLSFVNSTNGPLFSFLIIIFVFVKMIMNWWHSVSIHKYVELLFFGKIL